MNQEVWRLYNRLKQRQYRRMYVYDPKTHRYLRVFRPKIEGYHPVKERPDVVIRVRFEGYWMEEG